MKRLSFAALPPCPLVPTPGSAWRIQPTRGRDLGRIRHIQSLAYDDLPPDRFGALLSRQRWAGELACSAWCRGRVWGHAQALPWRPGEPLALDQWIVDPGAGRDVLFLYEVAIHPQAQGLGLGASLLAHVEAVARRRGLAGIGLIAYGRAAQYWTRQGFAPHPVSPGAGDAALASYGGQGAYLYKSLDPACTP